ncbi:hypothetical protein RCOM_0423610 [Ricinus communis]|uniref:Uncharacterized protein n=1 Tax=Ricinus communis TaxID=3988 RepID=B9T465_RICCO|nr:hypothetical protein RCOM_0423610 [Ricinus communis]
MLVFLIFFPSLGWALLLLLAIKKTLDLEDVPQLDIGGTVTGTFPVFRNKLELDSGAANRVSTCKLVKALILSYWMELLWTALFALLYTSASFVGPYLIDSFVQCLSGRGEFKNLEHLLASTLLLQKL